MIVQFYTLVDPRTGVPRYVGKTDVGLVSRLYRHIRAAKKEGGTPLRNWVRKLISLELSPEIKLIAEHELEDWGPVEQHYIRLFKALGAKLLNLAEGGQGWSKGMKHTEKTKRKMSEARKGWKPSDKTREIWSRQRRGRKPTDETRAKMRKHRKPWTDLSLIAQSRRLHQFREFILCPK